MFDFFTRHTAKDYVNAAEDTYAMPKNTQSEEYYAEELFRVGADKYGNTTLTLLSNNGMSMTITMNQTTCEQLVRMLRATYNEETPTEVENG
jgi:hypothetical protein